MSDLEFRYLDRVLGIQETELKLFSIGRSETEEKSIRDAITHITFGAWCETASFIILESQDVKSEYFEGP